MDSVSYILMWTIIGGIVGTFAGVMRSPVLLILGIALMLLIIFKQ